jgi:hypothetical protein
MEAKSISAVQTTKPKAPKPQNQPAELSVPLAAPRQDDLTSTPYFEYRGRSALIVIGGETGARYHFTEPGKRLAVDPRDRATLAIVTDLIEIRES